MSVRTAKTCHKQLLDVADLYLDAGGTEPIDLDQLARFAINNGHWKRHASKLIQLCKQDFARALRKQYYTDPQGRAVRVYHAARSRSSQRVFWADLRTAPHEHMETAFQQRRNQIVGDCKQLKRDVESYNDNNLGGDMIQMVFDFTEDLSELDQPTEYRPKQPR